MAKIFVHGAPETAAIWAPLLDELAALGHEDVLCLSPPGFGGPVPAGFGAAVSDYRNWLITEISRLDGPVDLVGHDWGGGHVVGVAMNRPDLLRSWTTDAIGLFEPDYVWHPIAQVWASPDGERVAAEFFGGSVDEREALMVEAGMRQVVAQVIAPGLTADMARTMIALYRSSVQPVMSELGNALSAAAARPGLVVIASDDDVVGSVESRRRGAGRAGAEVRELAGLGHWWMLEDPAESARILDRFWATL